MCYDLQHGFESLVMKCCINTVKMYAFGGGGGVGG